MKTNSMMVRKMFAAMLPVLFIGVILSSNSVYASGTTNDNGGIPQITVAKPTPVEVVENPEVLPQFKEGEIEIYHRLAQSMKYPKDAVKEGQQGKVVVEFIVNPNGTASDFKVGKSSGFESLDQEAVRVCKEELSTDWIPGKDKGKAVACSFSLPVMFRLN